jgi:catechol 2,3-dioxygenase-like lactoylglutathione lyase family enzyme
MLANEPIFDRAEEDVGNVVEFGHVNVQVPDQRLATLFYVSALGLTRDPYLMTGLDNMWINVGVSQFHLPTGPAQVFTGVVGLVLPDLPALRARLERLRPELAGTAFHFTAADNQVTVTSPWGNRLRCHAAGGRFGSMALGMPYVELPAPVGAAPAIGRFYTEVLGARASVGTDSAGGFARIGAGIATTLLFRETDAPPPPYDGHHIQIALADFSAPHRRLLARGLVSEESSQHQYRFLDVIDLDSGAKLVRLEHEVRSMRHPLFGRKLVNRNPAQTNQRFAAGHETLAAVQPIG